MKPWLNPERNALKRTLTAALADVHFPAQRGAVAAEVAAHPVTETTTVNPSEYVRALPDRRYRSADDVLEAIDEHWEACLEAVQRRGLERGGSE